MLMVVLNHAVEYVGDAAYVLRMAPFLLFRRSVSEVTADLDARSGSISSTSQHH